MSLLTVIFDGFLEARGGESIQYYTFYTIREKKNEHHKPLEAFLTPNLRIYNLGRRGSGTAK